MPRRPNNAPTPPRPTRQPHLPASSLAANRFAFERALLEADCTPIAGVDEAGRGPLAGPVVAAAVILPLHWIQHGLPPELQGLNDSKQLSTAQRQSFFHSLITLRVPFTVAKIDSPTIDTLNILRATHTAMSLALSQLNPPPAHALVDGLPVNTLTIPHTAIPKGDCLSYSIAAASVIAKVTRDNIMLEFDLLHPGYGFASHKGYGTPEHLNALSRLGPSPIHRRSFAPIRPTQLNLFPYVPLGPHQTHL